MEITKGCKIGDLTVVKCITVRSKKGWCCKCACGKIKNLQTYELKRHIDSTCKCKKSKYNIGDTIGKLTIVEFNRDNKNRLVAVCKCICNKIINVLTTRLGNRTTHCGCSRLKIIKRVEYGESAFKSLLSSYRSNSIKKGHSFELDVEEFRHMVNDNCHYCGCPPSSIISKKGLNGSYTYNGIDRLDSNLGYFRGNVVTCCKTCNFLKSNYSYKKFLEIVFKIYKNINSKNKKARDT